MKTFCNVFLPLSLPPLPLAQMNSSGTEGENEGEKKGEKLGNEKREREREREREGEEEERRRAEEM